MTATSPTPTPTRTRSKLVWRWRVVDIVVAAVIGVAGGVIYWAWNLIYNVPAHGLEVLLPGLQSLTYGIWLIAGVLAALIIRKPGAALFAELVAATVEALIGNQWGPLTIIYGVVEGIGAELIFAILLYASWRVGTAILAGALAGVGGGVLDLIFYYPGSAAFFATVYLVCFAISGALLGGLVSWVLTRALASTGALSRFASGRQSVVRV
jgi:energy-coupling factor transport system substrate-specific component